MTSECSTSDFLALEPVNISQRFTEMQEIPTQGFNALVRAKRDGQWWMLKGIKAEFRSDTVYQELLRKEYDILSRMQHYDIVAVEGMEEVDGYGMCIVMEWVDGETLKEWLATKRTRKEKVKIMYQLLDAVEYVHQQQIVHRDLKPSNVMITRNGQHVKLIDFGLADTDNYAVFKQPAGTEGYISPEQLSGSTPDSRNDIYSLGSILLLMRMGWIVKHVAHGCQAAINKRYADIASVRKGIIGLRRRLCLVCTLVLMLVVSGGAFLAYQKWHEPRQTYDVVADFKVGYLQYQSWGGGLVTVRSTEDVDSCVEIPATVTYQGISYKVSEITLKAFVNHRHLRRVVFPCAELHFMSGAFSGCNHLRELYFRSKTPPQIGNKLWKTDLEQVFDSSHFLHVILYVPKGSLEAYRQSEWKRFKVIKEYF